MSVKIFPPFTGFVKVKKEWEQIPVSVEKVEWWYIIRCNSEWPVSVSYIWSQCCWRKTHEECVVVDGLICSAWWENNLSQV